MPNGSYISGIPPTRSWYRVFFWYTARFFKKMKRSRKMTPWWLLEGRQIKVTRKEILIQFKEEHGAVMTLPYREKPSHIAGRWEEPQSFRAVLVNLSGSHRSPGDLVKKQLLIQSVWAGTWDSVFLISSRIATVVVHDCPYFAWQGFPEWT